MNKITVEDALEIAEVSFPKAPEVLVKKMGVPVTYGAFKCEGWCIQCRDRATISINNQASETRQRFTLAHELGHLILGIPSIVGESQSDPQNTKSVNEIRVNEFAGKILLPLSKAQVLIPEIPITEKAIKSIAKSANVSDVFVARRLASLSSEIGLTKAVVVFYNNDKYAWHWPNNVPITSSRAKQLLGQCLSQKPAPLKTPEKTGGILVASILQNSYAGIKSVFVQLVPNDVGLRESDEEFKRSFENTIYKDSDKFRNEISGAFGFVKSRGAAATLEEAIHYFNERYVEDPNRWDEASRNHFKSQAGQRYIRLRLNSILRIS